MRKMLKAFCLVFLSIGELVLAQHQDYTTPVPILKQIDRHNDDGSYTYGFEAADKSYKIETKYPTGEVFGKYGYVDDQGKLREIEYGASKRGFEPAGSDINVPPPTLTNSKAYPLGSNEIDDGQYREDPSVYYKDEKFNRPTIQPSRFSLSDYRQPAPTASPPQYRPAQQNFNTLPSVAPIVPVPQPRYQQSAYQQPYYQTQQQPQYNPYNGNPQHFHPAVKNIDIWSGSYSLDYTGRK